MKKAVWSGIITGVGILALSTSVYAQQTASGSVLVTANVNAKAKLTINGTSTASISFADADPDVSATVAASPLSIAVKVHADRSVTDIRYDVSRRRARWATRAWYVRRFLFLVLAASHRLARDRRSGRSANRHVNVQRQPRWNREAVVLLERAFLS